MVLAFFLYYAGMKSNINSRELLEEMREKNLPHSFWNKTMSCKHNEILTRKLNGTNINN